VGKHLPRKYTALGSSKNKNNNNKLCTAASLFTVPCLKNKTKPKTDEVYILIAR
jgi:hypothetical protein